MTDGIDASAVADQALLDTALNRIQCNQEDRARLLQLGVDAHNAGRLDDAAVLYRAVAQIDPGNADAWRLLGLIALARSRAADALDILSQADRLRPDDADIQWLLGNALFMSLRYEDAVERYDRAIALLPHSPEAFANRGVALERLGRLAEAVESYDRAIALKQDHPEAWANRGVALEKRGLLEDALASHDQAIAIKPDHTEAHKYRGDVLYRLGRREEALSSYHAAIALKPSSAEAHYNRSVVLVELERYEDAVASYDRVIAIQPDHAAAHAQRGTALGLLRRTAEALASFDRALELQPEDALPHCNRAVMLDDSGRHADAVASYDRAIAIRPDYADAYFNRGIALEKLDRHADAIHSYDAAITFKPDHSDAHCNRGAALVRLGRYHEALETFLRGAETKPDFAEAYWNASIVTLALGDYARGWQLHEWRKKTKTPIGVRVFPFPESTNADAMRGKRVLITWEQGLGDTIQFCRYLPMVAAIAETVVFAVPAPLRSLLAQALPRVQVIADTEIPGSFDVHCPLLSLPLVFGTTLQTIPATPSYIAAPADATAAFAQRLGTRRRPRVGLVWNGGFRPDQPAVWADNKRRNMDFAEIAGLNLPRIDFFSLQKGEPAESALAAELPKVWRGDNFVNLTADLKDFADTAALVENLDLVISVDTSTAHLAAAMGKPVWILLRFDGCWRWLLDRTDSPWYPSVRLFRQPAPSAWRPVIDQVREELIRHFADDGPAG